MSSETETHAQDSAPSADAPATPRFSLIVICRNDASHVVRSLAAITQQKDFDLSRAEVLFVDDGSTDNSAEVAERFGEDLPCFRPIRTGAAHGSGCGGARNAGLKVATGEYVWYLDGDDYLLPNALAKVDEALGKVPGADVCVFPFRIDREPGSKRPHGLRKPPDKSLQDAAFGPVAAWAKVIRRPLCIPFPERVMAEDCAWHFAQFDKFETFASVGGEEPLYAYDRSNDAAITDTIEWCADNPRTLEQLAYSNELIKDHRNDRWPSDFLRTVADMYDVRRVIRKPWVRDAWSLRFRSNCASLMSGRFTH